jgi:hypothetical protein
MIPCEHGGQDGLELGDHRHPRGGDVAQRRDQEEGDERTGDHERDGEQRVTRGREPSQGNDHQGVTNAQNLVALPGTLEADHIDREGEHRAEGRTRKKRPRSDRPTAPYSPGDSRRPWTMHSHTSSSGAREGKARQLTAVDSQQVVPAHADDDQQQQQPRAGRTQLREAGGVDTAGEQLACHAPVMEKRAAPAAASA